MNTIKSNRQFLAIRTLILVFVSAALFYGCRKEPLSGKPTKSDISDPKVNQAKNWYDVNFPKQPVRTGTLAINSFTEDEFDLSQFFNPGWDSAKNYNRFYDDVLEIPIDSASRIGLKIVSSSQSPASSRSSVLILKRGDDYTAFIMTVVGDPNYLKGDVSKLVNNSYAKHDSDFSGMVYYTTPQGKFVSGWTYKDGQISGELTEQAPNINNQATQSIKTNKVASYQVCTAWYQLIPDNTGSGSHWEFLGYTNCHTVYIDMPDPIGPGGGTNPPSEGSGGSAGGGSGSTPTPNPNPCSGSSTASIKDGKIINTIKLSKVNPADGGFPPPIPTNPCSVNPPGVFGLNGSNAVVPVSNFAALIAYAKSIGLTVRASYHGSVVINGVEYPGQLTEILDANGVIAATYFNPDVNGGPFLKANQYHIGNGGPSGGASSASSVGAFNGSSLFGSGSVTYTPFNDGASGSGMTASQRQAFENADNNRLLQLLQQEDALDDGAASPCHGTARNGNVMWPGTAEHWLIQFDYIADHPLALKEYFVPGSSGKLNGNPGYADIVNPLSGEMFEIKPDNATGQSAGAAEIQLYLAQANLLCPRVVGGGWAAGLNYPTRNLPDPKNPLNLLQAKLASSGVIVYSSKPRNGLPQPIPVVLPKDMVDKIKKLFRQIKDNPTTMQPQIITFVRQNPNVIPYLKSAAAGVIIGTLMEDVATEGVGILDDWLSFLVARTLWRVGNGIIII